jgi:hypothetical protein
MCTLYSNSEEDFVFGVHYVIILLTVQYDFFFVQYS